MTDQTFWVRIDGEEVGPASHEQLREYAGLGRVTPESLISPDRVEWGPAGRLEGLFAGSSPGDRPAPEPGGDLDGPSYPIIRLKRRAFGVRVTAVYADHLLVGSRRRRAWPPTEAMCHPSGEPELARSLSRARRIAFADVKQVREETTAPKPKRRWWQTRAVSWRGLSQFRIDAGKAGWVRLFMPASQATNVRTALAAGLGDRYQVRPLKRPGLGVPIVFGVEGLMFALLGVAILTQSVGVGLGFLGFGLAMLAFSSWYAYAPRGPWAPLDAGWTEGLAAVREQVRRRAANRTPFRSRWLGWALKVLGVIYWFAVLSPLTDPLRVALQKADLNFQIDGLIWVLVLAPAPLLIYCGYRLAQRRYEPAGRDDARRPILFLRPFEDDAQTTLQPRGPLAAISGIWADWTPWRPNAGGQDRTSASRITPRTVLLNANPIRMFRLVINYGVETSEESIARFFENYGPVIAIGKPGERLSAPGSARMYLDDDHWQEAILAEFRRSQAVVIQPGNTAGVRWELEQIRAGVEPHRVLVCLVSYWGDPQAYEDLAGVLRQSLGVEVPRVVPFLDRPAFLYFERGWRPQLQELSYKNPLAWPLTGNAADLTYTLHPFLQGMHGGDREPPRPPRWRRGLGKQVATAAALVLGLAVTILPVYAVHFAAQAGGAMLGLGRPHDDLAIDDIPRPSDPGSVPITLPDIPTVVQDPPTPVVEPPPIPGDVARAPRVTLVGRAVPYQFEVPGNFIAAELPPGMVEYWLKSPDQRLSLQICVPARPQDLTGLAAERLKQNSGEGTRESSLESARTVLRGGDEWTEVRIGVTLANGNPVKEIVRATSGRDGAVLAIMHLVGAPRFEPVYDRLAEEILDSLQVRHGDPPGPGNPTAPAAPPAPSITREAPPATDPSSSFSSMQRLAGRRIALPPPSSTEPPPAPVYVPTPPNPTASSPEPAPSVVLPAPPADIPAPPAPPVPPGEGPFDRRVALNFRGTDRQGPAWEEGPPGGAHRLKTARIVTTFGLVTMEPQAGKMVPGWRTITGQADQLRNRLHAVGDAYCYALVESRMLLTLKYDNLDTGLAGFLVVYRGPDGSFFYTTNGDNAPWKALGAGETATENWATTTGGRVFIDIARPNQNADKLGREIDYRFRLVEED